MSVKGSKRITFIVRGKPYETYEKTLRQHKLSYLAKLNQQSEEYCSRRGAYYIDKNVKYFEAVLFFYQSGILCCPPGTPAKEFVDECEEYGLPDDVIKGVKDHEGVLDPIAKKKSTQEMETTAQIVRSKIWDFLEKPETSFIAKVYALFSFSAILLSIVTACLETVKSLNVSEETWAEVEFIINCWFLFELVIRFAFSPNKCKFVTNFSNWVDAIVVVPYFVMMIFTSGRVKSLGFLRCFRFIRVLRLFRLSKQNKRMHIIAEVVKKCGGDFQMLFLCLIIVITCGASLTFFLDEYANPSFNSIPNSMYWCIVTLTTVGYGDIYPITLCGKFFSGLFMILGSMIMFLPVLAVGNTFIKLYAANIPNSGHLTEY